MLAFAGFCRGKSILVLQCGSDWCVSGECVRKVFESAEFRRALGGGYALAVYDDMENPTLKVKAANAKLERLRVESRRFPAITCLTDEPRRLFAQIENIPFDVTPKSLAAAIMKAVKTKDAAEELFRHGRGKNKDAADALGRGFVLLESLVGEFDRRHLREGPFAWREQWSHLEEIDADDRFGWRRRFTMGYGFDIVETATRLGKEGPPEEGGKFLATLRAIPKNNLEPVQRQCIEVAFFAYARAKDGDDAYGLSADETALLRRVLDMGRDTVWGQFALGKLILAGEKIETVRRERVKIRPVEGASVATPFKLDEIASRIVDAASAKNGFTEEMKRNIALYAVLRRIGEAGWNEAKSQPGSLAFMGAFFKDRKWMEDFAWSGKCKDWRGALLSLQFLCCQDGGRWIAGDGAGRRFATATALEMPGGEREYLADWLDACRATALARRLHAGALGQQVWSWRHAVRQIHVESDDPPEQQRFLDKFYNVSIARFGGALGVVPYRLFNCFGDSVHSPKYYEPWRAAGEWPKRKYSYIVGGVCGELSTFASSCSNAHGLPSVTVGQPGHCAFTRRQPDGTWRIDNFISPPTTLSSLWPDAGHWTYTVAMEATFEGAREKRHDADRFLELAFLAETRGASPESIEGLYRRALGSWPKHYTAWREYGAWLKRSSRPAAECRVYALAAMKTLAGWRRPLWDLLTPYFERVAEEKGPQGLSEALAEAAPFLRQGEKALQDEGDFSSVLAIWTKPLEEHPELMEKTAEAFAAAQFGTRSFFSQTLGWCAPFVFADEKRAERFLKELPKIAEKFARTAKGVAGARAAAAARRFKPDLGTFIAAAEEGNDLASFRRFAAMQEKFEPSRKGTAFKDRDFGGVLVSSEGMLTLSKSFVGDTPRLHPGAIDASTVKDFTFTADKGEDQWAMVTLAGPCELRGVIVSAKTPDKSRRDLQLPFDVEVSEDGVSWNKVFSPDKPRDVFRIELPPKDRQKARYVRVRRSDPRKAREGTFSLSKILVYGKKLY